MDQNGRPHTDTLAGKDKVKDDRTVPVTTLPDLLSEIRRVGGTGKLEIHFKNGSARGQAKWSGFVKDNT